MNSQKDVLNLLLIEDHIGDARLIEEYLKEVPAFSFSLKHVTRLADGIKELEENDFDLALIDLGLPDSHGTATVSTLKENEIDVPIIVLSGMNDEDVAIQAVKEGAQDYLVKNQVSGELLVRSIRYTIERYQLILEIKRQSVMDELTGLYNRRGFNVLSQQQMKVSSRMNGGFCLIYVDIDHMKEINDQHGHPEGDKIIMLAAAALKDVFSDGDILARIGGDEFAVISIDKNEEAKAAYFSKLDHVIAEYNKTLEYNFPLSLSIGYASYHPEDPSSLEELVIQADNCMYKNKSSKRKKDLASSNSIHSEMESLSKREKEVFEVLLKGYSNQEIADDLFISTHTVKNHVSKIFTKLHVADRHQLLYQYYKR